MTPDQLATLDGHATRSECPKTTIRIDTARTGSTTRLRVSGVSAAWLLTERKKLMPEIQTSPPPSPAAYSQRVTRKGIPLLVALAFLVASCSGNGATPTTTAESTPTTTSSSPQTTTPAITGPTPVIVDYSPTVSDVGGLMFLLAHPDVEVIAISLPVTGEAGCDLGVRVTLGILSKMGQEHVPVACDPEVPTESEAWPEEFLEGATSLLSGIPKLSPEENGQTGTDLIVEAAMTSDRPVTIYAVAPLTNVARALRREPGIADNLSQIVIMGGAVDVPGNVFDSRAEWNIFIDAAAAADVISSGVPITLVALDATNDVPVPGWYPIALGRAEQSDQIVYLSRLVDSSPAVMSGFFYLWDELTAAVVADAVEITSEEASLSVVVGGQGSGQTARDPEGTQITVATGVVSPDEFYAEFIGRLAGAAFEKGEATPEEEAYLVAVALSLEELGVVLAETFIAGSIFDSDEYDGDTVAEAIEVIFSAFGTSLEIVEGLDPPESLSELHTAYLEELLFDLGQKEVLIPGLRAATTWEEASVLFELLGDGAACEAVANEAFFLGVDAEFPCNP